MPEQRVEVVVVRDPDGGTKISVYVQGRKVVADEHHVDAAAGWEWLEWCEHRDARLSAASPACRDELIEVFSNPPGGKYVDRPDGADWLDGVQVAP